MLRKTISIDESIMYELQNNGILEEFKNFSELVSESLTDMISKIKSEKYRKQIEEASNDPMVRADIKEIGEDFKYADSENIDAF